MPTTWNNPGSLELSGNSIQRGKILEWAGSSCYNWKYLTNWSTSGRIFCQNIQLVIIFWSTPRRLRKFSFLNLDVFRPAVNPKEFWLTSRRLLNKLRTLLCLVRELFGRSMWCAVNRNLRAVRKSEQKSRAPILLSQIQRRCGAGHDPRIIWPDLTRYHLPISIPTSRLQLAFSTCYHLDFWLEVEGC